MQVAQSTQTSEGKFTATVIQHSDKENIHEPTVVLSHLNSNQYKVMFHPEQWSLLVRVVESALQTHYAGTDMELLYSGVLLDKLQNAVGRLWNVSSCPDGEDEAITNEYYEASCEVAEVMDAIDKAREEASLAENL